MFETRHVIVLLKRIHIIKHKQRYIDLREDKYWMKGHLDYLSNYSNLSGISKLNIYQFSVSKMSDIQHL